MIERRSMNRAVLVFALLHFAVVALLVTGCGESRSPSGDCSAGTAGCACLDGRICFDHEGEAMQCVAGRCSVQSCPPGAEGCACFPNRTCGRLEGSPMTCENERCRATRAPEPGTLGGVCSRQVPCRVTASGQELVCEAGRCSIPGCAEGSPGCPCGALGACDPVGGRSASCWDGICLFDDCQSGALACPCDGTTCVDGALCEGGICRTDAAVRVVILDPTIRACDLTFVEPEGDGDIRFDGPAAGRAARRGRTLLVGLHARNDAAMRDPVATVRFERSRERGMAGLRLDEAQCWDRAGIPIPSPRVELR